MGNLPKIIYLLLLLIIQNKCSQPTKPQLHLVTVATEETDGLKRLRKSAAHFGHDLHVFGLGEQWTGGDMHYKGGAQKIKLLRDNLAKLAPKEDDIILFVDAYDVVVNADAETLLRNFFIHFQGKRIVFSAEPYCWPDRKLAPKYPPITFGERYLNSGMFMGFTKEIVQMLNYSKVWDLADDDDDQLFYTKLYIDSKTRNELGMALDSLSLLFQNLNGMQEFVTLQFEDGNALIYNKLYNTHPAIIHGNGPSKIRLNELGNYLVGSSINGQETVKLDANELPTIALAVFIAKPIPYVEEFLEAIVRLDYPKKNIHLYLSNNQAYNQKEVEEFERQWSPLYSSMETFNLDVRKEHIARSNAIEWAANKKTDFLLILDADAHLSPAALKHMLAKIAGGGNEIGLLTPLLLRNGTLFSNFWGAISETGYYARSFDYVEIVEGARRGIWNVPFIGSAILISQHKFELLHDAFTWNVGVDADIAFAEFCRDKGHFLYVDASEGPEFYGFLTNTDGFAQLPEQAHLNLEVYDFPNNLKLWESRYIHPEYFPLLKPETVVPLACPDVYDFPFLSERFCKEIIQIMEEYGQWSDGSHKDRRLQGGYENVPTRDIHMNQVGLDRHFLKILDDYIAPMQEKVFIGFYQRPIQSNMMFVVRYRPDEQASLRPHHDASTYSIDVALNQRGIDYEGGGVRYHRYNCTVEADKIGWTMLFPGRLTHLHEGLPTVSGTRYIFVSFINP